MKKVLVSLLVLALAMTSVFAAVNFSGELVAGYAFQYSGEKWTNHIVGQDGEDTNTTKLLLGIADDNGVWSVGVEGVLVSDGRVSGDLNVDLLKAFGLDTDFSLGLGLLVNDEQTGLRAYNNLSGKNFDRIRTAAQGLWAGLNFGYGDLIKVQVAGSPATGAVSDGGDLAPNADGAKPTGIGANAGDLIISAMSTPIEGLTVSVDWALKGEDKAYVKTGNEGIFGAAVNANVGAMLGLDFDLGVALMDRWQYGDNYNAFGASVYGGVDLVQAGIEYVLRTKDDQTTRHFFYAKADFNVVENMTLGVFGGAMDLLTADQNWYVGGNIGYTISGVTFKLNVEYGKSQSFSWMDNVDGFTPDSAKGGLWIVPSVKVAF